MYGFSVDIQPLISIAIGALLAIVLYGRYRDMRAYNRVEYARQQLKRFAMVAQRNGSPEASAAYDNASHIVGLILQRGVNVEPELTWAPDMKIEGSEVLPVAKDTA